VLKKPREATLPFTFLNHVPRGYTVAAILSLLFMVPLFLFPVLAPLFFYVSTYYYYYYYCGDGGFVFDTCANKSAGE
jgi:hypothetical protein